MIGVAHCSHIHQPLDLVCFGVFKRNFQLKLACAGEPSAQEFRKALLTAADVAWQKASIPDNITKSFERGGFFAEAPHVRREIVLGHRAILPTPDTPPPPSAKKVMAKRIRISGTILTDRIDELREHEAQRTPPAKKAASPSPKRTSAAQLQDQDYLPSPTQREKRSEPTPAPVIRPAPPLPVVDDQPTHQCSNCGHSSPTFRDWWSCSDCTGYWLCRNCLNRTTKMADHCQETHNQMPTRKRHMAVTSFQQFDSPEDD